MIHCDTHGETQEAYVCSHLVDDAIGQGFNRGEPSEENPFPDAWCDNCNLIYEAHNGWNDETEGLLEIKLLCSSCYEKARIRNTRTDVSFEDLANLRWKCHSCEEWHTGPCLDFSFGAPFYWDSNAEEINAPGDLDGESLTRNYLDNDLCIVDGENYFVRGLIYLPIIGSDEYFRWGVWGSLSKENFIRLLSKFDDPDRTKLEPMFSWLSSEIEEYEDTLNLKMYAHIDAPGVRPSFELEPTDHQLAVEYHHGISPERVKQIMKKMLKEIT